ncbi:Hypp3689 [Branchiostoma lanceolatum]|uniref:Hypp3689 protein n=1 Tax=Branchiostoma lanceolatum TaxID=7740 RepID=A0A8K0ESH7_BRALA|nr:Hypp3689 [Branchiostoma lanceolatum]
MERFPRRGRNGTQKEPTNGDGEGTVDNVIYDSATFSANRDDGGVSFRQSDGFVDNDLYAGVGDQQNQTSQKDDQDRLYANVNNTQDEGLNGTQIVNAKRTENSTVRTTEHFVFLITVDGNLDMIQGSRFPTEIDDYSVAGVIVIMAITVAVVFLIRSRVGNDSQKESTNGDGEESVHNTIYSYESATLSTNEIDGGVSVGQSDGFVDNNLYAGVGDVQNQTSQKNDQERVYANVNEGFVDNDMYVSIGT